MVLDGKSSQEYPVNAGAPKGFTLGPTLCLLDINDLPDNADLSMLMILLSILSVTGHLICGSN